MCVSVPVMAVYPTLNCNLPSVCLDYYTQMATLCHTRPQARHTSHQSTAVHTAAAEGGDVQVAGQRISLYRLVLPRSQIPEQEK